MRTVNYPCQMAHTARIMSTTAQVRILCIEPTVNPDSFPREGLEKRGYSVSVRSSDRAVQAYIMTEAFQIIVVNALMATHQGPEICHSLRRQGIDLPILLLLPEDAVPAPDIQADVVLVKPFTIRKVVSRIKKLLAEPRAHVLQVGDVQLNCRTRLIRRGNQIPQKLTPKQAKLLEVLMQHPGQVLTRSYLMKQVWQTDYMGDTRTLDVHIRWVREKLEPDPANPTYVTTKRRMGYRFTAPEAETTA